MHVNVVIAGAGPAGLACARQLQRERPELEVLVLEAGRPYRRRPCPVDRGRACTGCAGICNVVSGFGGSMHWGDGVKLSLLPSGRRLVPHLGEAEALRLCQEAFGWLTSHLHRAPALLGQDLSQRAVDAFARHQLQIREYPVAVLGESDLRAVIENTYDQLSATVRIWHTSELLDAVPDGQGLKLSVSTSEGERPVSADHLVLATGRRGVTSTAALLRRLGVPMSLPDISVGVRFEMAAPLLETIGDEHPDLKISQNDAVVEQKTKTFCFCGGGNGGRVKFTHYQGAFGEPVITLDGHETTERPISGRELAANFGLLCQVQDRGDANQARASFLAAYRALNNSHPFAQTLRAFLDRSGDEASWAELELALPFQPSILDLSVGRVDRLFTDAEHASLKAGFGRVMGSILGHRGGPDLGALLDEVLVIGPELEFLWERPEIDASGKVPGLPVYVAGDAAGIAQGVVQAAMMGFAAGKGITQRIPIREGVGA